MDFLLNLDLPGILGPVLATLFGLITLDVLLGVAVALRTGTFKWQVVATFYKTNVLPYGLAALAIAGAAAFVSYDLLPPVFRAEAASLSTAIGITPMFLNLVVGSIIPNVKALLAGVQKWQIINPEWDVGSVADVVDAPAVAVDDEEEPFELPDPY